MPQRTSAPSIGDTTKQSFAADLVADIGDIYAERVSITSADSPYTALSVSTIIDVDTSGGAVTINFPAASIIVGLRYEIYLRVAGNNLTLDPDGSETFSDGSSTITISIAKDVIGLVSDGIGLLITTSPFFLPLIGGVMSGPISGITTIGASGIITIDSPADATIILDKAELSDENGLYLKKDGFTQWFFGVQGSASSDLVLIAAESTLAMFIDFDDFSVTFNGALSGIAALSASGAATLDTGANGSSFGGTLYLGDSANANMTRGLTINQGAADDEIWAGKSSDVTHGMTGQSETDTFGSMKKGGSLTGGLEVRGFSEDEVGLSLQGSMTNVNTDKTASGNAAIEIEGHEKSGTGVVDVTANGNILAVRSGKGADTRFIVDAEGDIYADGGTTTAAVTVYDGEDDASMVRAFDMARSANGARGFIKSKWDEFVTHGEADLVSAGILGAPLADGGLTNFTRLVQLHNGALGQAFQKISELTERLALTEQKLLALEA